MSLRNIIPGPNKVGINWPVLSEYLKARTRQVPVKNQKPWIWLASNRKPNNPGPYQTKWYMDPWGNPSPKILKYLKTILTMVYKLLEAQLLKTDSYDSFDLSLQSRLISSVSFLSHSFFVSLFLYILLSHFLLFSSVLFSIIFFVREWFWSFGVILIQRPLLMN